MTVAHIYPAFREWKPYMSSFWGGYDPLKAICGSPRREHAPLSDDSVICSECASRAKVRLKLYLTRKS